MKNLIVLLITICLLVTSVSALTITKTISINQTAKPGEVLNFVTNISTNGVWETVNKIYSVGECSPFVILNKSSGVGALNINISIPANVTSGLHSCDIKIELSPAGKIINTINIPIRLIVIGGTTLAESPIPPTPIVQSTIAPVSTVVIPPTQVPQQNVSAPKIPEVPMFLFGVVGIFILGVILFSVYIFKNKESDDETFTLER